MQDFLLGICQLQVTASKEENLERAWRQLKSVAGRGASVAVLPEMFNCPYSQSYFTTFAESTDGPSFQMLKETARQLGIFIIGGSLPLREEDRIYNCSPVVNPAGEVVACHRKLHLFDVDLPGMRFQESATLTAGDQVTVVSTPWARLGVAICYDIRFPELARLMVDDGATVLLYPAAFGLLTGRLHWELTLRARAVDNQVFTVGVGPAPNHDLPYAAYGHSLVCNPMGRVIKKMGFRPSSAVVPIKSSLVEEARESLPLLRHRRKDIYRITGRS